MARKKNSSKTPLKETLKNSSVEKLITAEIPAVEDLVPQIKSVSSKKKQVSMKPNVLLNTFGFIETVSSGIAQARGLFKVRAGELVRIYPFDIIALALSLGSNRVGLVLCGSDRFVNEKDIVVATGKLISLAINKKILGTVIDPLGLNLVSQKVISGSSVSNVLVENPAPDIISRQPIFEPLLTGLTVVDSLVPIGRGQRELIIGDRQTGKRL